MDVPRRLRIHVPGGFYHVTLRGNHQQDIFRSDADRLLLNAIVGRAIEQYGANIHAYCWMSNHLHFLLQVGERPLGNVMRQIASGYARAFQQKLPTTGHLFERRYHATLVDVDTYFLEVLRYIHLNPVRAQLVAQPADYRWSSHHAYAGGTLAEPWLTTQFALSIFSSDARNAHLAYRRFMACVEASSFDESLIECDPGAVAAEQNPRLEPASLSPESGPRQTLAQLIDEACRRFGVAEQHLSTDSREPSLVRARAWIAREALKRRISTLSAVARALGRDRATLRFAIRRHALEG
jgi:putative transposase